MGNYDQGSEEMLSRMEPSCRHDELYDKVVWRVAEFVAFAAFIAMFLLALMGCAGRLAVESPLVGVRTQETIHGMVQVAQMNADCDEQEAFLKRVISDAMVQQGAPSPDKLDIRPLSGSSLCGWVQGTAQEVIMLELGARNRAQAEVMAYWSGITHSELQKAHAVLTAMRPIPAAVPKTAQKLTKK